MPLGNGAFVIPPTVLGYAGMRSGSPPSRSPVVASHIQSEAWAQRANRLPGCISTARFWNSQLRGWCRSDRAPGESVAHTPPFLGGARL